MTRPSWMPTKHSTVARPTECSPNPTGVLPLRLLKTQSGEKQPYVPVLYSTRDRADVTSFSSIKIAVGTAGFLSNRSMRWIPNSD